MNMIETDKMFSQVIVKSQSEFALELFSSCLDVLTHQARSSTTSSIMVRLARTLVQDPNLLTSLGLS